uniref:Putative secreted protein n=1 Tax=Anopheles darlingi TaxID=43151 RepID=A0A2M4DJZ8_ANODA
MQGPFRVILAKRTTETLLTVTLGLGGGTHCTATDGFRVQTRTITSRPSLPLPRRTVCRTHRGPNKKPQTTPDRNYSVNR